MMNQENAIKVFLALAQESRLTAFRLLVPEEPEGFAKKTKVDKIHLIRVTALTPHIIS